MKEVVDGAEIDISNQENVSQRTDALRRNSKQQIRHRASVACYSCRDRRIRCVVPKGALECMQCKRSGTECVIKMDDERRRPISKAYVSSLSARIIMLESMLEQKGVAVPPATHPPVTKHEAQCASSGDDSRPSFCEARRRSKSDASLRNRHVPSPPYSHEEFAMSESPMEDPMSSDIPHLGKETPQKEHSQAYNPDFKEENILERLLFLENDLLSDQSPSKLYSAPANSYIPARSLSRYNAGESPDQVRRAERIIRSLTPKTHDYLMQNFWKHHNTVFQVVDKAAFEADRGSENPRFYSSFLHVVILALGWRFADKDRCDVARINLGNHESAIHREAKQMLDADLERPTGMPSIQSLLLLGDLECGVGRDNTGWMYAGMANRLAFGLGLNIDDDAEPSDQEARIRRRVMRACVLYDKYWALFQGRTTSVNSNEIGYDLSKAIIFTAQTYRHIACVPKGTETVEEEIHNQLFDLMGFASRIVDLGTTVKPNRDAKRRDSRTFYEADESAPLQLLTLDQQLQDWYRRLPSHLTWGPDNIRTAPCSYFLLHEQYYAIMILLHRSRGDQGLATNEGKASLALSNLNTSSEMGSSTAGNRTIPARRICTEAALQFSEIVSQAKERCDLGKICCTSLQPATIASIALLAAIAQCEDHAGRRLYHSSLEVLTDIIRDMSRSYHPSIQAGNLVEMARTQLELRMCYSQNTSGNPWGQDGLFQSSSTPMNNDIYANGRLFPAYGSSTSSRPRLPTQAPPSPSYSRYSNGNQPNLMSSLVPRFSDSPESFVNSEPLYTTGTQGIYSSHGMPAARYSSNNFLRLAPSAKGWGLHSLHAASHVQQSSTNLDSQMPDWIGESATALHEPKVTGQNGDLSMGLGSGLETVNSAECKRENSDSLSWINSDRRSSVFTESMEFSHSSSETIAPLRNYELDYLSL